MRFIPFCAIAAALLSSASSFSASFDHLSRSLRSSELDIGFLMDPGSVGSFLDVPGAQELQEVLRVGARALDWVDLLQRDVPTAQREQIWRRSDRIGHEPTPDRPMRYNPDIILANYRKALTAAPAAVARTLQDERRLPISPPEGLSIKDVVDAIRPIHETYSRSSRWLMLYQWRHSLDRGSRDRRAWLKLRAERAALGDLTRRWSSLDPILRERVLAELADACPIVTGESIERCRTSHASLTAPDAGRQAAEWLDDLLARGQREYDLLFSVVRTHEGVHVSGKYSGPKEISVPTVDVDASTLAWIKDRVAEAWSFKGELSVTLFDALKNLPGAVRVEWEKGALPHVNSIAGDVITMDSNTPKWLEHTQTVMRHEFGHVLGFPDCYTEFWEEELQSFTYYSLDPSDAMCALSGEYSGHHRDALLKGYFSRSGR